MTRVLALLLLGVPGLGFAPALPASPTRVIGGTR